MNYNILKIILERISNLKGGTMLYTFIFCIACCLWDCFYLRHFIIDYSGVLEIFRIIYMTLGIIVHIFIVNNFFIFLDKKKEEKRIQKTQNEEIQAKVELKLKEVERLVQRLNQYELALVKRFVEQDTNIINIQQSEVTLIGFIYMKGLAIQIQHYYDVIQAQIPDSALYFLKLYLSEGLKK